MTTYIHHITLGSGHITRTPLNDIDPAVLDVLLPWLDMAIKSAAQVPLPLPKLAHFSARALKDDGLIVTVYGPIGPHKTGVAHHGQTVPLVTFGVARHGGQSKDLWGLLVGQFGGAIEAAAYPPSPWCGVILHETIAAHPAAAHWLGDFERCTAWAWIGGK